MTEQIFLLRYIFKKINYPFTIGKEKNRPLSGSAKKSIEHKRVKGKLNDSTFRKNIRRLNFYYCNFRLRVLFFQRLHILSNRFNFIILYFIMSVKAYLMPEYLTFIYFKT